MNLSQNFNLDELCRSQIAIDCGIDNTPDSDAVVENLKLLCEKVLQPIRDHYGKPVKVSSGYRSEEINTLARGSRVSDHILGFAADIEIPGVPNAELAQWVLDNLDYTQVILEFYTPGIPDSGWVHVSYKSDNLKKEALTATRVAGKTTYTKGLVA
ncbi:Peptidase M15A, C-terminal [uncultured Caudovirales phage]|uniref:Peptidase M15A, C-terminal n=1 Tax=uncultured Caudovirales phage TaxID=2100421 RepID=A0A6J5RTX3_9CAUD|nr:Peptidase M15A, C-terminal [uncultured Caudovirales phage]